MSFWCFQVLGQEGWEIEEGKPWGRKKIHFFVLLSAFQAFPAKFPVPLVLDLRITHDRFGSSSDSSLNGNLHYPHNINRSLIETVDDKIRKYHVDYNNDPPHSVSFMFVIASTSGMLHSEFVRLSFLQTHRETDRFFTTSGVHLA
jgi:hypothetical protein